MESLISTLLMIVSIISGAFERNEPVGVLGGSLWQGKAPYNGGLVSPFFGAATNSGSYLDGCSAMERLGYKIICEAEGGSSSFVRESNFGPGNWVGYQTQYDRVLQRTFNPVTGGLNIEYLIIDIAVDCLTSDSFGIPQDQTTPCTMSDFQDYINRIKAIVDQAAMANIKVLMNEMIPYSDLDLNAFLNFGILWVISESDYNLLKSMYDSQLGSYPNVTMINGWEGIETIDGIHPTDSSSISMATKMSKALQEL